MLAPYAIRIGDGDDASTWYAVGEALDELEHHLRYGSPDRADALHAAGVIGCYRALVCATQRRREHISRELRRARETEAPR